jgi:hypothetical protein
MNTPVLKIQGFAIGETVLTSKNNKGVIIAFKVTKITAFSKNTNIISPNTEWFVESICVRTNEYNLYRKDKSEFLSIDKSDIVITPLVKLGSKEVLIEFAQLQKLDKLNSVKIIYSTDPTGFELDKEIVLHLPEDFCLYCHLDNAHEKSDNIVKRILPYLRSITGHRDFIQIFKINSI